jgi:putative transposase
MCRVLGVHRSGFYAWLKKPMSNRALRDRKLLVCIQQSYDESSGVYGSPRIHRDLHALGIHVGRKRVARLMRANGLRAVRGYKKRRFKSGAPAVVASNHLGQDFRVDCPNKIWVTDITYLRCNSGWAYLAAIMDLYSRKIVGWQVGVKQNTNLVIDALRLAINRRTPEAGLTVHSDQGSQYSSYDWLKFLKSYGLKQSMSRRGNCYDNAAKESFFSSLKMERVQKRIYQSLDELRPELSDSK